MRILRMTGAAVGAVALIGLGTAAWAAETANVPAPTRAPASSSTAPVTKPMTVVPAVVAHGGSVSLVGAGCTPGTTVFLSLAPASYLSDLGSVTADAGGHFKAHVAIPAQTPAGARTIWAACKAPNETGKQLSTAAIEITN